MWTIFFSVVVTYLFIYSSALYYVRRSARMCATMRNLRVELIYRRRKFTCETNVDAASLCMNLIAAHHGANINEVNPEMLLSATKQGLSLFFSCPQLYFLKLDV